MNIRRLNWPDVYISFRSQRSQENVKQSTTSCNKLFTFIIVKYDILELYYSKCFSLTIFYEVYVHPQEFT